MGRAVPSATRALQVLRFLGTQPGPVPVGRIASRLAIPRSSAYHLLDAMIETGFVIHYADERTYGLGLAAFEVGSGYLRQAPLQRIARQPLAQLVDAVGESAHLAVLHGRDVLYVVEERAAGRPSLVTDVGVRLPAHLTASGRAMLARLSGQQVRALFPDRFAFVDRYGAGPRSLTALTTLLTATRQRGYAFEDGEVTPGLASVATAVTDPTGYPVAGLAITYESRPPRTGRAFDRAAAVRQIGTVAGLLAARISGDRTLHRFIHTGRPFPSADSEQPP